MEELQFEDFNKICRFCLKIKKVLNLLFYDMQNKNKDVAHHDPSLLKINQQSVEIIEIIYLCTGLKITTDDGLPPFICNICMNKFKIYNNFRLQCHSSNEYLLKLLKNYKLQTTTKLDNLNDNDSDENNTIIDSIKDEDDDNVKKDNFHDNVDNKNDTKYELELDDYNVEVEILSNNSNINLNRNNIDIVVIGDDDRDDTKSNITYNILENNYDKNLIEIIDGSKRNGKVLLQLDKNSKKSHNKFQNHYKKKKYEKNRPEQCQICGTMQKNIRMHMVVHSGEKNFACDVCGKRFAQKSNLRSHLLTHTNVRSYKCKYCVQKFRQPAHLMRHTRTHTGERNFQCDACGKKFTQSCTLHEHRLTHTQERKHKCEYCNKLFLTRNGLRSHVGIHTGIRPFKCGFCPKEFINSSSASVHRRIHLIENAYECSICKIRIQHLPSFKLHVKEHSINCT